MYLFYLAFIFINNILAKTTFLFLHFHAIPTWFLTFISTAFSSYPEKYVSFLFLPLHQRRKMHTWQTECTIGILRADVVIKILIKNVI